MPTNTKPTIPTLLAEWGQMTQRERDAAVYALWNDRSVLTPLAYTSEDSPASLVAGLEEKVIEMLRAKDAKKQAQYAGHIDSGDLLLKYAKRVVMHESENGAADELAIYRMSRKQRACACWLAVKMEGME